MKYNISFIIDAEPGAEIIGIKEDLATHCERFGDVKNVSVELVEHEQMKIEL
jgi:hypothetical protein